MAGLYDRSLRKRREIEILRLVRDEEPLGTDDLGITPDERIEFRESLDDVLRRRTPGMRHVQPFVPVRSGAVLPTLVNLLALLVAGAIGAGLILHFNSRRDSLVSDARRVESADARLLSAIREEAEARLEEKDQQIQQAESRLAEMAREQERLRVEADLAVATRESELRVLLDRELERLRSSLQREGASPEEINERLEALETQKQGEHDVEIAALQESAAAKLREQESAMQSLAREFEASLEEARLDREELEALYARRMTEASELRTEAEAQLETLQEQQSIEQLMSDQILASYEQAQKHLESERFDQARGVLDNLEAYLQGEAARALPALQRRRSSELFVIDALRQLVDQRQQSQADLPELVESARLLQSVAASYDEAEKLLAQGLGREAEDMFRATLGRIPSVQGSFARLEEADEARIGARWEAVLEMVAEADAQYVSGNPSAAISTYTYALVVAGFAEDAAERLVNRAGGSNTTLEQRVTTTQADSAARPLLSRADRLAAEGNSVEAFAAYLSILERHPDSSHRIQAVAGARESVDGIRAVYEQFLAEERSAADAQAAESLQTQEELQEAADAQKELAAAARDDLLRLQSDVATRSAEQERELRSMLAALDSLSEAAGKGSDQAAASEDELFTLVELRLQLRRVLSSLEIQRDHPDLYEGMNDYLNASAEESLRLGRAEAAADVAALVRALAQTTGGEVADSVADGLRRLEGTGHLDELILGLRLLIEGRSQH